LINKRQVSITLFVIGAILFGCGGSLGMYFAKVRPVEPSLSSGFTHPLADHGKFVYLTSGESWLHDGCFIAAAFFLILAAVIGRARR
jgi:hypothetical protein